MAIDHDTYIEHDGKAIPKDPRNRDYREALAAIEAGDLALDAAPAPAPAETVTLAELLDALIDDLKLDRARLVTLALQRRSPS